MFTGIITEIGKIVRVAPSGGASRVWISAANSVRDLTVHDSIAVDGICLTVVRTDGDSFGVDVVEETLKKTTAGSFVPGARVNLEMALRVGGRLGGHLVQGHVDCVGTIRSVQELSGSRVLTIEFPGQFSRYVVPVGSIALNGVSLTVASVTENRCTLSIIPYTLEQTTLGEAKSGVKVNVEFDLIGKYVERMFPGSTGRGGISGQQLEEWGYGE